VFFATSAYVVGPLIAFAVVAILAAILRWTFDADIARTQEKLFAAQHGTDYGLLRVVGIAADMAEARALKDRLSEAGIRATFSYAPAGHVNVLVFDSQLMAAKQIMGGSTL
jgi:hypothetical protein